MSSASIGYALNAAAGRSVALDRHALDHRVSHRIWPESGAALIGKDGHKLWIGSGKRWVPAGRCLRFERGGYRFIDLFKPNKFELLARLFGNILEVLTIPRWQHDTLDAGL